ncbi:hypothetical protein A3A56_03330 [Candidatus Roizmanbacteria bacterium RIFCSPLOWO2_01_FULL_40_32]|nr:MAG: hypothetical protein A3A56_03330 [Candidatus Roizmanbacteria bacterium RIFCSPLOWO2_01_FULL_40_32]
MEALGIDGKLLLAQLINFGLFFLIFKKFMAKPFFEFIKKQQEAEKEKDRMTEKMLLEESKMEEREKKIVEKAQKEAAEIIQDAKNSAKKIEEKGRLKAQEEVGMLKAQLKKQLEEEEKVLRDRVKKDVMTTSGELVRLVLRDSLDSKQQSQIVANLLKKADTLN